MKFKHAVIATVVAFLISNVFTTVWYMIMDKPNFVTFRREEINYAALMVNHLVYAVLMVYLAPYYFSKHKNTGSAFIFGCVVAALMFIPSGLVVRSIWTVDINTIFFLNTIAHLVIGGVMAVVVFFILKKHLQ